MLHLNFAKKCGKENGWKNSKNHAIHTMAIPNTTGGDTASLPAHLWQPKKKKHHRQRPLVGNVLDISQAVTAQGAPQFCTENFVNPEISGSPEPRTFEKIRFSSAWLLKLLKFGKDTPKKCSHNNSVKTGQQLLSTHPGHVLAG